MNRFAALGAGLLAALAAAVPAAAHVTKVGAVPSVPAPVVASDNVRITASFPTTRTIAGEFARTGNFFYTSGLDSIQVWDTSDPRLPILRGVLPNIVFENEAMSYGERMENGVLRRFVLVGVDLYQAGVDTVGVFRGANIHSGGEVIVVDVTDPVRPYVRGRAPSTTSTHTVQCLSASCEYVYTSGSRSRFSVMDLRNLDKPVQAKEVQGVAGGHYWDVEEDLGIAWQTGTGAAAFDIADPLRPKPLASTNAKSGDANWNDFILHNSYRPNAARFKADAEPSLANGNVLLVAEEDYLDVSCATAGAFETWHVKDLERESQVNPGRLAHRGTIEPLDKINPVKAGEGLGVPVSPGFCSAHWFDFHQSGIVAQGYYQQGMRLIDVRDPKDIKQYGYYTSGASEVWDAYWVPQRDAQGRAIPGRKTNVVYVADAVRGLEVLEIDGLPAATAGDARERGRSGRRSERAAKRARR